MPRLGDGGRAHETSPLRNCQSSRTLHHTSWLGSTSRFIFRPISVNRYRQRSDASPGPIHTVVRLLIRCRPREACVVSVVRCGTEDRGTRCAGISACAEPTAGRDRAVPTSCGRQRKVRCASCGRNDRSERLPRDGCTAPGSGAARSNQFIVTSTTHTTSWPRKA